MQLRTLLFAFFAAFSFAQTPGQINTIIGTGTAGSGGDNGPGKNAQVNGPSGVVVDSAGNVYVADKQNAKIRRLSATSDVVEPVAGCGTACSDQSDGRQATATSIGRPADVAIDALGNLYLVDTELHRVRKVSSNGILTNFAGTSAGFSGDGGPATTARLNNPQGIAIDGIGNVYIADLGNQRIRKVAPSGIITTVAGNGTAGYSGDGGQATSASLNSPQGVGVDSAGNFYIADTYNYRVRKVTSAGIISTVAGNGLVPFPSEPGDEGLAVNAGLVPWDVDVDQAGNIYISDWQGNRIRKVFVNGFITSIAGNGVAAYSGDGGPATSGRVNGPTGIALDALGNVYFADTGNHRVRKINAPPEGPPVIRQANPVVPSFMGKAGFSSNMYVEIYGSNFARSTRVWSDNDFSGPNAPTTLNGVSVTINNKPAFIYYASPTQINVNVPDDAVTGSVPVQVRTAEGLSNFVTVNRVRLSPTMLTTPAFAIGGKQYVVAQTPDRTYVGRPNMIPGTPFTTPPPGSVITIFALGLGPTSPSIQAGVITRELSGTSLPVQVKIGGIEASLAFSGTVPGFIGVYQLNVVIPNVAAGDQKIELTVDGVKNEQDLTIVVGP